MCLVILCRDLLNLFCGIFAPDADRIARQPEAATWRHQLHEDIDSGR